MTTRTAQFDPVATRSERAVCDPIYAWAIKTQKRIDLRSPSAFGEKMTDAAQVSLALLADGADKQQRTFKLNPFLVNYVGECD